MKKILLVIAFATLSSVMYAGGPLKFSAGLMVMPTNMWMFSQGFTSTDGQTTTPQFVMNTNMGLVFGLNFTDLLGVEVDVIFGKHKYDFTDKIEIPGFESSFDYSLEMSKIDIPVLFRLGGMMYFEVGPQFTMIQGVDAVSEGETEDFSDFFTTSQMYGILGTGVSFGIPKIAKFQAGLRLGYGFSDINAGKGIWDDKGINTAFWGLKIAAVHEF